MRVDCSVANIRCLLVLAIFLSACSGKIAQTKFATDDVEITVKFTKIERHDPHDWVFAEVEAKFRHRRSLLDMRCLQFISGKYISNRVWVDSYVSYFPTLEADKNRLASKQFYWVVDKGISPADLKKSKIQTYQGGSRSPNNRGEV